MASLVFPPPISHELHASSFPQRYVLNITVVDTSLLS